MTLRATRIPLALALSLPAASRFEPVIIRHDRADEQSVDLAKRFDATASFLGDGCGTLIAPRWILTAAHVARGQSPFSPRVRVDGADYGVRRFVFHPDSVSEGRRPPHVDLALVELEEAVSGVDPAVLYRKRDEVGRAVFVVGYGDFGPAGARLGRGDGTRRAATNTVDRAERGRLYLDFDAPPEGTALEGVGGPGDSGGPLYLETDEQRFVVGVSSASMGGRPGSYDVVDVYTRVSEFAAWIDEARANAPAEPAPGRELIELADGFPEGQRGELIDAFFQSLEAGEADALSEFELAYYSAAARRRNPGGAFARRMSRLASELGSLTPVRLARPDPERWVVLARSRNDGWRALHFRFATDGGEVRLRDLGLRREPPPQ